jgi:zinc/manganese transport system permease protein
MTFMSAPPFLLYISLLSASSPGQPTFSWNLLADWQDITQYAFMRHAFLAGTIIAIVAGVVGYFVMLRGMAFASHTLANIGFAGAAGAVLLGVNPVFGLLTFTLAGALGMSAFGKRLSEHAVAVGIILAFALGLGVLFISLYHGYSTDAYSVLFGQVLGITEQEVIIALILGTVTLLAIGIMYRPLLFASLDEEVAIAKGLPVQALAVAFLIILALAVAEAVQIVGVLLIFALLVTPAAIAERLTVHPARTMLLAVVLALLFTWGGLIIAYYLPYSLGFFITSLAFGTYLIVRLLKDGSRLWQRRLSTTNRMRNIPEGGAL